MNNTRLRRRDEEERRKKHFSFVIFLDFLYSTFDPLVSYLLFSFFCFSSIYIYFIYIFLFKILLKVVRIHNLASITFVQEGTPYHSLFIPYPYYINICIYINTSLYSIIISKQQ